MNTTKFLDQIPLWAAYLLTVLVLLLALEGGTGWAATSRSAGQIEKRFDKSWKRVQVRAKKLKITQKDIEAEIRAVRTGK